MKLGVQVGLGPGHIVLDGDSSPLPQTGRAHNFRSISVVAKMPLGMEVGLGPGDFVLNKDTTPSPKKTRPMFIVAKRPDRSR